MAGEGLQQGDAILCLSVGGCGCFQEVPEHEVSKNRLRLDQPAGDGVRARSRRS
jgi:hypothetical protein